MIVQYVGELILIQQILIAFKALLENKYLVSKLDVNNGGTCFFSWPEQKEIIQFKNLIKSGILKDKTTKDKLYTPF